MAKLYRVDILASRSRVLYTEMTNNLIRRVCEHREGKVPGFTWHYRIHRLVYCEPFSDVRAAMVREKQIEAWTRRAALIEKRNPVWICRRNGLLRWQEKKILASLGITMGRGAIRSCALRGGAMRALARYTESYEGTVLGNRYRR